MKRKLAVKIIFSVGKHIMIKINENLHIEQFQFYSFIKQLENERFDELSYNIISDEIIHQLFIIIIINFQIFS